MPLCQTLNARTALVHVTDPLRAYAPGVPRAEMETSLEAEGHALLTTISGRLGDPPPSLFVRAGAPADEIVAVAREWKADLIVTASHGRSGMPRLLLGSTAESVLRQAGCAVMVVKPEAP